MLRKPMVALLGPVLLLLARAAMPAPPTLAVTGLETSGASEALGIDDPTPRLTWRLASDRRGVMQTSYRVLVASRPDLLARGQGDVWDSGTVTTADPAVRYAGPPLRSRSRYFWTVRVTASPGAE